MNRKSLSLAATALLLAATASYAQSLFDFPGFGLQTQTGPEPTKPVEFDYNFDFQYFFDYREFSYSQGLFMESETYHLARLTPTFGVKVNTDGHFTHRLLAGVDLTKNLGENPTEDVHYAEDESDPALINTRLFKNLIFYYNLNRSSKNGRFDLYAGIYPRTLLEGEYSRAMFSEALKMTDPNMEGVTIKYRGRKLSTEIGYDWLGSMALDRRESYMAYTAGSYSILDWLSAGWDATYTHVGDSYIFRTCVDDVIANPFIKVDFGHNLGMQELSVKAGALASLQLDSDLESTPHLPIGVEGVFTVRNWGLGLENTIFYGDNMMPYRMSSYSSSSIIYTGLLYFGEPFYFTRRGYPSGYDRLELFYEPFVTDGLSMRISAVGHCIFPSSDAIKSFLGWQAKASLFFNLDNARNPRRQYTSQPSKKDNKRERTYSNGPEIRL